MWGAAPPDPSPGGRADWAGAGAGAARGPAPGEGGEGRRGRGSPPTPARLPGLGPPRTGRGMEACRDSPFVQRRLGRAGGQGALSSLRWERDWGVPSPGAPSPGSPAAAAAAAATAGSPPPPPPWTSAPAARPPFLLAPWLRRRRRLAEPRRRVDESARSRGAPGPAGDPAGGAAGSGAPSFSFRCRRGRQAGDGERLGEGRRAGVGLQAVSHGSPSPAAVRTPLRSAQAAAPASQTPIPAGEGLLFRAGVGAAARP